MLIYSPTGLHYPVLVTRFLVRPEDDVTRNGGLFNYTYTSKVTESDEFGETQEIERTWPATFESETDGQVKSWKVAEGDVLRRPGIVLLEIEEPCRHDVQYGGMCTICGKDMTLVSYNTQARDTDRATINMAHGNTFLTVSASEARRQEEEVKKRLLESRKLSLVVDLDQTIIHATVDPTVGEWQRDPENPNYDSVKDVRAFQLSDEGPRGTVATACWYYIKLRPGLVQFLETISTIYECHIYTMGTRAYAQNIAKIVDPDRRIFGDRILSRDESGSMQAKNLQRLFPVDTKMVLIIDDRGDVWKWSPNLVRVAPYDFFIGIGDINSSFLPKRAELEIPPPVSRAEQAAADETVNVPDTTNNGQDGSIEKAVDAALDASAQPHTATAAAAATAIVNGEVSLEQQLVDMAGSTDPALVQEQAQKQEETIAAQLADRPLLQKQKILEKAEEEAAAADAEAQHSNGNHVDEAGAGNEEEMNNEHHSKYRHNLLVDDDTELYFLETNLRHVHEAFFTEYDKQRAVVQQQPARKLPGSRPRSSSVTMTSFTHVPDIKDILPPIKQAVLQGTTLVFSGIVPLGVDVFHSDIALWAQSFGATISTLVNRKTTHVVAAPTRRTAKVRQAARYGGRIKIVSTRWLLDSISRWARQDETPYRIHFQGHRAVNGMSGSDDGTNVDDSAGTGMGIEGDDDVTRAALAAASGAAGTGTLFEDEDNLANLSESEGDNPDGDPDAEDGDGEGGEDGDGDALFADTDDLFDPASQGDNENQEPGEGGLKLSIPATAMPSTPGGTTVSARPAAKREETKEEEARVERALDPESPIGGTAADWKSMGDEVDEMLAELGSEDEGSSEIEGDVDEEAEGDDGDDGNDAGEDGAESDAPPSKKRKRAGTTGDADGDAGNASDSSSTSTASPSGTGSRLQKRKKNARDRKTSLMNAVSVSPPKDMPGEKMDSAVGTGSTSSKGAVDSKDGVEEAEEDEAALEAAMEAELEAEEDGEE